MSISGALSRNPTRSGSERGGSLTLTDRSEPASLNPTRSGPTRGGLTVTERSEPLSLNPTRSGPTPTRGGLTVTERSEPLSLNPTRSGPTRGLASEKPKRQYKWTHVVGLVDIFDLRGVVVAQDLVSHSFQGLPLRLRRLEREHLLVEGRQS